MILNVFLHQTTSSKTNCCVADWKAAVISLMISSCYIFYAGIIFNQRWRLNHHGDIFKCSIHFFVFNNQNTTIYLFQFLLTAMHKKTYSSTLQ
jgi:hypothetical protein